MRAFVDEVLIHRRVDRLGTYVDRQNYTEHSPLRENGFDRLAAELSDTATETPARTYTTIHRVLAEGSFVLSMCEGTLGATHSSFYDLHRVDNGRIVEHWDTVDAIPPQHEWTNNNGKF